VVTPVSLTVAAYAEDAVLGVRFGMASRFAGTARGSLPRPRCTGSGEGRSAGFRHLAGSDLRSVAVAEVNTRSISIRFKHTSLTTTSSQGAHGREREFWRGICCAP
jgi:hypothetical protein